MLSIVCSQVAKLVVRLLDVCRSQLFHPSPLMLTPSFYSSLRHLFVIPFATLSLQVLVIALQHFLTPLLAPKCFLARSHSLALFSLPLYDKM